MACCCCRRFYLCQDCLAWFHLLCRWVRVCQALAAGHCCFSEKDASITVDCARSDGARQLGERVGLEYWMVGVTCGFRVPGWVMLRSDTRW